MGFIEHLITNIFISLVLTIPFFLAVNIVLFLAAIGRPAHIEFVTGVRDTCGIVGLTWFCGVMA